MKSDDTSQRQSESNVSNGSPSVLMVRCAGTAMRVVWANAERERREAAASDSRMHPERNGCLPFAPRFGSARPSFSVDQVPSHLKELPATTLRLYPDHTRRLLSVIKPQFLRHLRVVFLGYALD